MKCPSGRQQPRRLLKAILLSTFGLVIMLFQVIKRFYVTGYDLLAAYCLNLPSMSGEVMLRAREPVRVPADKRLCVSLNDPADMDLASFPIWMTEESRVPRRPSRSIVFPIRVWRFTGRRMLLSRALRP